MRSLFLTAFVLITPHPADQQKTVALPFACDVFSPATTADDLAKRFGPGNITNGLVPWGGAEGDMSDGTILFGDAPEARLLIHWQEAKTKARPGWLSVRDKSVRWRTTAGLTVGTTLRDIEKFNGRPFRLVGFGSDVSGTVMSWSGGRLDKQDSDRCRVRVRVGPDWDSLDPRSRLLTQQLEGEREYSSGHPAMQALNPRVYELVLQYH